MYWLALPYLLPPWNDLLTQIAKARINVERDGWLTGKPQAFLGRSQFTAIDALVGVMALVMFYVAKVKVSRASEPWQVKVVIYVALISLILPYFYIRWEDWENPHVYFIGNWFGIAFAVLVVPTITFVIDVVTTRPRSLQSQIVRSAVELIIGIPAWCYFWIVLSFFVLNFGWL